MTRKTAARIGLALAGSGPLGAIDEIGAPCALGASLTGLDFSECTGLRRRVGRRLPCCGSGQRHHNAARRYALTRGSLSSAFARLGRALPTDLDSGESAPSRRAA